jgi:tRNA (guanine37-N1)-methyltransferase
MTQKKSLKVDILTLFPDMFKETLGTSIIGRAQENGLVQINCINIRDFADNKHNRVDDTPYGGGDGMVMQAQPIYDAIASIEEKPLVCHLTPKGKRFDQSMARHLASQRHIALICGHYEGIDERVIDEVVDIEISLGDFVVTGGEIPAMAVIDAVVRLVPGVLADNMEESHYNGLLEYPHYTRPREFMGREVPEVLLNGNHQEIQKWRDEKSLQETERKRPDLLEGRRVGILGGTFNPIHVGHLDIAWKSLERHKLDKVLFVPCNIPSHKSDVELIDSVHRANMVQIAIQKNSKFELCMCDIERGGVTYTIDTIDDLKKRYTKTEFYYIIGEDWDVSTWKAADRLVREVEFIKLPRELPISSTEFRETLNRYLVPERVFAYIEKHNLYKTGE